MQHPLQILTVLAALALAGCTTAALPNDTSAVAPGGGEPDGLAPSAAAPGAGAQDPQVLTWSGHLLVAAALEAPAHVTPTDKLIAPLWHSGFVVEITEPPELLELAVDWTSVGPSEVMLMMHNPHGAERETENGWGEYTTHHEPPFATQGPLCMRIPQADIVEDLARVKAATEAGKHVLPHWYPMVHAMYGANVQLEFTVTSVGGAVSIPDAIHGHEITPESVERGLRTALPDYALRPWEPCGPAA